MGGNSVSGGGNTPKAGRRKYTQHSLVRLFVLVILPLVSLVAIPDLLPGTGPLTWALVALFWLPIAAVSLWLQAYPLLAVWALMTQRRWVDHRLDARIAASLQLPVQDETRLARTDP